MIYLIIAALLFAIGIGFFGGALFGSIRQRRLNLLGLSIVLWLSAALLFTSCAPPVDPPQAAAPTSAPVEQDSETQNTATPEPSPTPLPSAPALLSPLSPPFTVSVWPTSFYYPQPLN